MLETTMDRMLYTIISLFTLGMLMIIFGSKLVNIYGEKIETEEKESFTIAENNYSVKNIENWRVSDDSLNVLYDKIDNKLIVDLEYLNDKIEKDFVLFPILDNSFFKNGNDNSDVLKKFKSNNYTAIGVLFDRSHKVLGYINLDSDMDLSEYTNEFNQLLKENKLREDKDSDPESREIANYIYSKALKETNDIKVKDNGLLAKVYTHDSYESKIRSDKLLKNSIFYGLLFILLSSFIYILVYIFKFIERKIEIKKLMEKYPNFAQLQTELKTFKKSDLNGIYFKNIYIDKLIEYDIYNFINSDFEYVENINTYFNSIPTKDVTKFYNSLSKIKLIYGDKKLKDEFITSKTFAKDKKALTEDLFDLNDFLNNYPNVFNFYNKLKEKTINKLKLNSILNDGMSDYSNEEIDVLLEDYMDKLNISKKIQGIIKTALNKEK